MSEPRLPRMKHAAPAVGYRHRDKIRVVVSFDDETFNEIKSKAVRDRTSFAEQVRQLVEWGLMSEKE